MKVDVTFESVGDRIAAHLYCPEGMAPGAKRPALIVGGPLATVKEQAQGVFAASR